MDQLQEMQAQVERWKAMGLDLDAAQAVVRTAYAGGTTPLGLSQWALGDKPRMEDFNRDNARVDELFGEMYGKLEEKADKNSPQELELDLAAGLVSGKGGKSVYWRNQFGEVTFLIAAESSVALESASIIARLPEGFAPASGRIFCANAMNESRSGGYSVNVLANGEIRYYGTGGISEGMFIWATGTFLAK